MMKAAFVLLAVYVSVPLIIYLFPWTLAYAIFAHLLKLPYFVELNHPEYILNHTCNFYLDPEEGVRVGIWHTLPASQWDEAEGRGPEWYRSALGDGSPIIIYLHGNVGTRAKDHRVQLVKILSSAGFHILSLDYRGFGDSTGKPSEHGVTADALHLYRWVKQHSEGSLVCLWGHSLGSGSKGSAVDALILEAPFTNIGEVLINFPLAKLYTFWPGFELFLWDTLEKNKLLFANENNLKVLTCPLLILHAEDDDIVPYDMGQKLHQIAARTLREKEVPLEMISYPASRQLSHSDIYLDPDLAKSVRDFLQKLQR
ncbi:lysophosphatidylserine lipase ABHD12-like [Corythoichthys intestinalis]|uniref:lysophosphatidylserine lipase ABHD12-like n=1 Tax=Corythoichthys intestinalis TaxID=161448 RepID=UPI0025A63DBD|nr:lysophosphatidylserine lipase ABHD12-like [Corythoichthys intestinalis]XP_061798310.1 lysophosphatidylserine lipase ABHD12-like [Nerophis lumbriciformis]